MSLELKRTARILIRLLERVPPDEVKGVIPKDVARDLLELTNYAYRSAEKVVQAYANEIRERAKKRGIRVMDHGRSCRKKKGWCFTCLSNLYGGRFKPHGLYWEMKMNNNGERRDWRNVREGELRDLLRQIGFSEGDIEDYEYALEMRDHFIRLRNYYMVTLKHLEILDENDIDEIIEEKDIVREPRRRF